MDNIKINKNDYEPFLDYKDLMIQAFGIGCSICGDEEINFVLKNHPETIGNIVKKLGNKTDEQIEQAIELPLKQWQEFDDSNADNNKPVFICEECWNSFDD